MACRIGISEDPERRKEEWKREHQNLRNWQILDGPNLSYSEAQRKETELAKRYECESSSGGPDNGLNNWSVYYFEY